jgi:hypothetical protein
MPSRENPWRMRPGTPDALPRFMSKEPPGVSNRFIVSSMFGAEQALALSCLRRQARVLRTACFRDVRVELAAASGALSPPRLVFLLDDGRALAWFGEARPYVVHPSFGDLCDMHGLREALVHAA